MTLKIISLYTGIGGIDFGFEAAGFETSVALELDSKACAHIRLNRSWPVIENDINLVESKTILSVAKLKIEEADVLIGGPPCQPFSKSAYWNGDTLRLDDPRANTLVAYLRVLRDTLPKVFLIENVPGIAYSGKDEGLKLILDGINQINKECGTKYSINWKVLNAANYGVPQIRERVFIIGSRDGKVFQFPAPSHYDPQKEIDLFSSKLEPYRTAWDAIGDFSFESNNDPSLIVNGKWGKLLPSIPEGKNYLWHTERGGGLPLFEWRSRYWSFLLKLSKRLPSWTIQAQPGTAIGPFHWNNRRLTTQEMTRLQTFPDGLQFRCGRSEIQRMIGNAVPSLVAEILAKEIRKQFFGHKIKSEYKLLPQKKMPIPAEESVTPAPENYIL